MTTDLEAKLDALDGASIVRPNADPQAAAMTALLVADWLGQRDVRDKLAAAGVSRDAVEELRGLSRLVLAAMSRLGGDYLSDAKPVPGEILEKGYGLRTQLLAKLEEGVHDDAIVVAWLEALKLGSGVVDLVYDLRTLAELHREHEAPLSKKNLTSGGLLASARSIADNIEYALREGEGADGARHRNAIARAWTLFAPGYERAASAARKITREAGAERKFPPLGLVASYRRGRRRAVSLVPMAPPPSAPQPPRDVVKVVRSDPPPAPSSSSKLLASLASGERKSGPESRLQVRYAVELEMGFESDSNFWVGFTENISASGVFVATYAGRPIGSRLTMTLNLPDGEAVVTEGVVRWTRAASTDGWPGMGVQFDAIKPEDEAKIRKFLSVREPLFYDV
ncbi:MAG TPA: TIGR02266 family protein [Labilithrix sp.]